MPTHLSSFRELLDLGDTALGTSSWVGTTQEQVDMFATATGDRQWIHTDVERAASGPFGGTIAHGYLTLALAPVFMDEVLRIDGVDAVLNYGVNKVRFIAPVPVGAKVRAVVRLLDAKERPGGDVEAVFSLLFQLEGSDRPCCVAETVYLYR